jgi:hypothetical protein
MGSYLLLEVGLPETGGGETLQELKTKQVLAKIKKGKIPDIFIVVVKDQVAR